MGNRLNPDYGKDSSFTISTLKYMLKLQTLKDIIAFP